MHGADGEVGVLHFLGQPVDLLLGVAEDDGLGDCEGVVEVDKGVELPLLLLDVDEELAVWMEA